VSPNNGGNMRAFVITFRKLSSWMNTLGGIVLFLMMMLTVVDVFLRVFGKPLVGTYELVAIAGAIVVGFAIPQTSLDKGHINVDFLIENRGEFIKKVFSIITRLFGIILFALIAWNLFLKANHLYKAGDVSLTLQIPYYPAAYGLAFCALIECFVLITDIFMIFDSGEKK
jgi:TRAP-type C4-dicarboxylate transport system permease small subunit